MVGMWVQGQSSALEADQARLRESFAQLDDARHVLTVVGEIVLGETEQAGRMRSDRQGALTLLGWSSSCDALEFSCV